MTKAEYIALLTKAYRQANLSDTEDRADWQNPDDCATHCQAIETIVRGMLSDELYQEWLDSI